MRFLLQIPRQHFVPHCLRTFCLDKLRSLFGSLLVFVCPCVRDGDIIVCAAVPNMCHTKPAGRYLIADVHLYLRTIHFFGTETGSTHDAK